jgi:hypothetical protein
MASKTSPSPISVKSNPTQKASKNIFKNVDILLADYERVKTLAKKLKAENKTLKSQKSYYETRVGSLVLDNGKKNAEIAGLKQKVERLSQVSETDVCQIIHDRDYYQKEVLNWRTAYMKLMKRYIQLEGEYETMEDSHYNRVRRTIGMEEKATKSDMGDLDKGVHDDDFDDAYYSSGGDYGYQEDYGEGCGADEEQCSWGNGYDPNDEV